MMENRLFQVNDSKSPARKGIPVRPRAPAPKEYPMVTALLVVTIFVCVHPAAYFAPLQPHFIY